MATLTSASSSIYTDHVIEIHVINNICLHELIHSVYICKLHVYVHYVITITHLCSTNRCTCNTYPLSNTTYNMSLISNTSVPLKSIMALRADREGKVGSVKCFNPMQFWLLQPDCLATLRHDSFEPLSKYHHNSHPQITSHNSIM